MSPMLHVQLLGDFSLTYDGRPVEGMSTPRLQSLVAYLVLHRDAPQLRQHLAFLFWPDSSEAQARNNLRQLLYALRRALPSANALLSVDSRTLQWRCDAPLWIDVDEFAGVLVAIERIERGQDVTALYAAGEQVLNLYQTDLLPGCYDEWIVPEREHLRDRFLHALDRLIQLHEQRPDYAAAIRYARRLIRSDALNEEAHRRLMRLHALSGDRSGELLAFQNCVSILQRELGIGPSQVTEELHQRLQQLETPPTTRTDPWAATGNAQREPAPALPALVGRQRQWETLQRAWLAMNAHGPGFVLITGEPGIGKSRLAEEMARWAGQVGATTATARSYAVEGRLAFAPVVAWLRGAALRPHIGRLQTVWLSEVARVLPELLAEHPDLPHYEPINDYGQRQRFFQALALAVLTAPQPLLLVMDDLQWCDQETLEWLHFLLRLDPDARVLIIGIARTEETPPDHPLHALLHHLRHHIAVTEVALQPLDAAETAELAARILDTELDTTAAMRLFGETEGNPLFVVETVHAGLDALLKQQVVSEDATSEDTVFPRALASPALPAGVRTVIAGRLAQLSAPARELAALAAMLGREFSLDILIHVSQSGEESIVRALDELWRRRIMRELGPATYDFTHDKLREVAQAEISAPQRHLWHRRIAPALEAQYADDLDRVSGQIAAHYEQGGALERAIPFYHRAALVAQRVFTYEDAIRLLRHCLALLEQTPSGTIRDKQELLIQLALAPLYRITRGWTAPELERVVDRTLALCDTVGDDGQRAEALYGLQSLLVVQARLERVQLVAEELHALHERTQVAMPPLSDMMLAGARLHLGRLGEANDAFERVLTTPHDARQTRHLQEAQGWNVAVHTRAWRAHALWCLGDPERAIRSACDAVELAHSLEEPFNQALATTYLAMLWQMSSDATAARERAEEALALTMAYKAPYYRAWAAILVAYAHAHELPDDAHTTALRTAIAEFEATGGRLRLTYYLALLAGIYGQAGRPEEGLEVIEEALVQARDSNERWWDAELHRLRGELMFAAGRDARDVEAALLRAADIARGQNARSLELRAHLSRYRLHGLPQRANDSRRALRDVYSRFTEGFDTPDLRAAQALLARRG
ncbi:MAG: ATP-binding protein [Ktedonobacterales bacterium]